MSWSARVWFVAFAAAVNIGFAGCAARTWPRVDAAADQSFVSKQRPVTTVDVLPVDIQVWASPQKSHHASKVVSQFESNVRGSVDNTLAQRGYQVVANMDWSGNYRAPDGRYLHAMDRQDVWKTAYSLSGYGYAVSESRNALITPHLPAHLGGATGSDATLYVGGWAYVGKDPSRSATGAKVAKGILIGLAIVVIVAVVIVAARKGGGGGLGKFGGSVAKGAAKGAVRVASGLARGAARIGAHVVRGAFRASDAFMRGMSDSMGRSHTHIEIYNGRPDYYKQDTSPKQGTSQMYVEMTLVDNRTGDTLWHAKQRFEAGADHADDVSQVVRRMLETMPSNAAR